MSCQGRLAVAVAELTAVDLEAPLVDQPWVEALCAVIADNAGLLASGKDSTFQNKVHLAMQAKGFFDEDDGEA